MGKKSNVDPDEFLSDELPAHQPATGERAPEREIEPVPLEELRPDKKKRLR